MLRVLFFVLIGAVVSAHDVVTTKLTWSAEISRIVYRRCASCHRDGGMAPMSLMTYAEARPWAKSIRNEVLGRRMPLWGAVKGYGDLQHDQALTQDEITRIAEWVEGGAPEGNPKYLPTAAPVAPPPAEMPVGQRVKTATIGRAVALLGVRPLGDVDDAKIYAQMPDGRVEPLVWLHSYRAKWDRTFLLKTPLTLPKGTVIQSQPTTPVELLVTPRLPAQ